MLKIVAVVVILLVGFIVWRWTSVGRGARQRDAKLIARIDPIARKIEAGESVSTQEVAALAAHPELRYMLWAALSHMNKAELLPGRYSSSSAQGESALAYWLMHPNELQEAPEKIELVESVRQSIDGREADFHVYRYKMPAGHWAARDGWMLGLAGPMPSDVEPYSTMAGAFARAGDVEGKLTPAELVDWYVGMLRQRGLIK